MDEAMHPLTILAVGLYGEMLPNQNGAPLRLVVPWKYGFKSIKSIVEHPLHRTAAADLLEHRRAAGVRLLRQRESRSRPPALEPGDASGASAAACSRRGVPTLPFNGYAEQVAGLYTGMDLRKHF